MRPPSIGTDAWEVIWTNFVSAAGPTWGHYVAMLSENAIYLGMLGLNVTDISDLLAFELAQAEGFSPVGAMASATDAAVRQPGLDLVFSRIFPRSISQRLRFGPLGWGWSHNWDFTLQKDSEGNVIILGPAGARREFQPDVRGGFFAQAGDYGKLIELDGGGYELRETGGSKMVFRPDGRLDFVEDLNANRITAVYSGTLLSSVTHSAGQSLQFGYSGGLLQSVTDPFGRVTSYAYNGAQHLAGVTAYGTNTVSYTYSTGQGAAREHALTAVSYPGGTSDEFAYDVRGRLASMSRGCCAEKVTFAYDALGGVFVTDALTNQSKILFDHRGLVAKVENPLGHAARFDFDRNFNVTSLQGPDGKSSALTLDTKGNVTKVLDPAGHTLAMTYTANARLDKLTDARGQVTDFNYDSSGNATNMVYPDGSREVYTYDAKGQVIAVKNRRGQVINYVRDSFGRVTHKATPEGRTFDYEYDGRGNLTNIFDSMLGNNSMTYDHGDLLSSLTYHDGKGFTFAYDAAGRRTRRTSHDGYTLRYFYNSLGKLKRLEDGTGRQIIQYLYDGAGRLSRENKGNNTWTTYEYDAAGQVLRLVNYGTNGVPISRFDYTYDANGNRTSMTTLEGKTSYVHDSIGQLTGVTYPSGRNVTYAYDAAGNRTAVNDDGTNMLYTVNGLNQYAQVGDSNYLYDADGNLTNKLSSFFVYDSENRLISLTTPAGIWSYTYNAFGNRVETTHNGDTTKYAIDPIGLGNVVAVFDGGDGLIARYDHGLGLVDRKDSAGNTAYYSFSVIGHTTELTDSRGIVKNTYSYDPFGISLSKVEAVDNPFEFVGRFGVMNDGDEITYMRERFYSQAVGRFLSTDPIGIEGDINLYRYANNSPTRFVDPKGENLVVGIGVLGVLGVITVLTADIIIDPEGTEDILDAAANDDPNAMIDALNRQDRKRKYAKEVGEVNLELQRAPRTPNGAIPWLGRKGKEHFSSDDNVPKKPSSNQPPPAPPEQPEPPQSLWDKSIRHSNGI